MGGVKGRREAVSTHGPGLVVGGRTSEWRPEKMEGWVEVERRNTECSCPGWF